MFCWQLQLSTTVVSTCVTPDTWNLPQNQRLNIFGTLLGAKNSCWNCGKMDHSLDHCTQPQNEERIAENCGKWMEANGQNPKKK